MNKILKISSFFIFPLLIFILNYFLFIIEFYKIFSDFDIIMHFLGGFSIAYTLILFYEFFKQQNQIKISNRFILIFIIISCVSLIAVFWEFLEFFGKNYFELFTQADLNDTLLDLFMGIFGGAFLSIIYLLKHKL